MQLKGTYTGKVLNVNKDMWNLYGKYKQVRIGKISGYHSTGEPVYDLINFLGKKVGEMGNNFIKKYLKNNSIREQKTIKNWFL